MRMNRPLLLSMTLLMSASTAVCAQSVSKPFVYPAKQQTSEQQSRDDMECLQFGQQQTGFNPAQGPQVAQGAPQSGGAVSGAAKGAALGAIGGAIGGDAGKGAAIGAGVGATGGLLRKNKAHQHQQQQQAANNSAYNEQLSQYYRAYGACMQGRGYTVN